jgi:hypothetical protein
VAPRTVDQNWYIEGPMIHDTPFGSTVNHYVNNLSGPVLMTPEFMFKLGGSYRIPWLATWMGGFGGGELLSTGSDRIVSSTDNDWLPSSTIVDFSLNKNFTFGGGGMGIGVSLDILNAFNHVIRPRTTRLGVKFFF